MEQRGRCRHDDRAGGAFCLRRRGLISWRNWQRAGAEKAGSAHHLLEGGDGRTRFMSMVGMISSGLFLLAVIFALTAFYLVAGCNG
jgi:hypothetical protein